MKGWGSAGEGLGEWGASQRGGPLNWPWKCGHCSRETFLAEEAVYTVTQRREGPGWVFWTLWQGWYDWHSVWVRIWVKRRGRLVILACERGIKKGGGVLILLATENEYFPPSFNILLWKITDVPNIGDNSITDPHVLSIKRCQLIANYVSSFTPSAHNWIILK